MKREAVEEHRRGFSRPARPLPLRDGTSARLALLHARGDLAAGQIFIHESILDTEFRSRVAETAQVGPVPGIIPEVSGRAWLTGVSHYGVDPEDPFPQGYRLNDTWFRTAAG